MTLYYAPSTNALQKTLDAALDQGVTASATLNNVTGIQNKAGVMLIDRVDSNGNVKSASDWEWVIFSGTSGSTVTTLTRGAGGSSDQDHAAGAIVEFVPDAIWADGVMDALDNAFTSAGALDTTKVVDLTTAQTLTTKTLTTPVLASFYQDAGKTKLMTTPNTASDTLAAIAATQTLTNKRITPRVSTEASAAEPTINTDNVDMHTITALATAITSMTTNLSGTPTNGQKLIIRILDDGTARAITWGASFASRGATLPTTTVASKYQYNGFIYNSTASKWDCVATINEA